MEVIMTILRVELRISTKEHPRSAYTAKKIYFRKIVVKTQSVGICRNMLRHIVSVMPEFMSGRDAKKQRVAERWGMLSDTC